MEMKPRMSKLLNQIPDRYQMILTVAKRAREIESGADRMTRFNHPNPLTVAAHEVADGLVKPTKARKESFI